MASSQRSWSLSSLPLDLIEEIFYRTPAESLVRAKPTCKKWCDLINNKRFIYGHLRRFSEQRRFLRIDETVQIMEPVARTRSETPIPHELQPLENIEAMVHCNGLMLCKCSDMKSRIVHLALWNPLTKQIALIPPSTCFTTSDYYGIGHGINKYQDGYKILRFSNRRYADHYHCEADVEIYYCKTSCWRTLDDAKVDWNVDYTCQGVSVMGNMYWLANRVVQEEDEEEEEEVESYILGFNFTAETFKDVCFSPPIYDDNYLSCFDGDKLSLLQQDQEEPGIMEVWVSSKLPDDVSFTKYFRVVNPDLPWLRVDRSPDASNPVYYIAKNKRIVAWCEGVAVVSVEVRHVCIILYEIDEGGVGYQLETERHDDIDYVGTILCGYVYVPSLVPLP